MLNLFFTYAAFFAVLGAQPAVVYENAPEFVVAAPGAIGIAGTTSCKNGGESALIRIPEGATFETRLHELIHAVDCLDDGMFNASPATPEFEYICGTDPECYARAVTRFGRWEVVRPHPN